jgi:uncharacterized membrane protein
VDLLDEEVFAVIIAIMIIGSIFAAAQQFNRETEHFNAIGLLNEKCKIGDYPDFVLIGENITLCIYIFNYMGEPEAYKIIYRFGNVSTLPTNTTPSKAPALWSRVIVLNNNESILLKTSFPIPNNPKLVGKNATLIFELWMYDTKNNRWVYTGRWVHLHVKVKGVPLP